MKICIHYLLKYVSRALFSFLALLAPFALILVHLLTYVSGSAKKVVCST